MLVSARKTELLRWQKPFALESFWGILYYLCFRVRLVGPNCTSG